VNERHTSTSTRALSRRRLASIFEAIDGFGSCRCDNCGNKRGEQENNPSSQHPADMGTKIQLFRWKKKEKTYTVEEDETISA
jgi:hypothetical protein